MTPISALLLVDVQNDFCPGGALGIPAGDAVIPPLNRLGALFSARGWPVIASRDWHPARTGHFASGGGVWPDHCVQGTAGAAFHPELRLPPGVLVVSKGTAADEDAYSAWTARDNEGRSLSDLLRAHQVERLYIGGLATDYCVRATVGDALRQGLAVTVLADAIIGVEVQPGDCAKAVAEMRQAGAVFATSAEVAAALPP